MLLFTGHPGHRPQGPQGPKGDAGTGLINRGAWSGDSTYYDGKKTSILLLSLVQLQNSMFMYTCNSHCFENKDHNVTIHAHLLSLDNNLSSLR